MLDKNEIHVVHIIAAGKFTLGYIRFMEYYFKEYHQIFITGSSSSEDASLRDQNVVVLSDFRSLLKDKSIHDLIVNADKIIVSGLFGGIQNYLSSYDKSVLAKTYLQFWGGDFYKFRELRIRNLRTFKRVIWDRRNLVHCIENCGGVINLIESDWNEFCKIFPYDVKHFVAPMPADPNNRTDYISYRKRERTPGPYRILVGNSSTRTNKHIEAFQALSKFAQEDIEIIVPLSYGDLSAYRDEVINKGSEIFGDKFKPILDYMEKSRYVSLLNSCEVGIFNNDRQQAMGNIGILFSLGKKVYIRQDTAMWRHYSNFGFIAYDVNKISEMAFDNFILSDESTVENNMKAIHSLWSDDRNADLWNKIFKDDSKKGKL